MGASSVNTTAHLKDATEPMLIVHAEGDGISANLTVTGELWRIDLGDSDYAEGLGFDMGTILDAAAVLSAFRRLLSE